MKIKFLFLLLAVFIVSTCLTGCGRATSIRIPDHSIPFLTLVSESTNNENVKKAFLNFWDLKNRKIIKTDKVIYTVTPTTDIKSEQATYETYSGDRPLYWDGEDWIIFPSFFKSETKLYEHTETFGLPKGVKGLQALTQVIFGKDVEMLRVQTGNPRDYRYTVKLWDGEKYIEKELNLNYKFQDTNSQPSYPVAIGSDEINLYILVSGSDYNPQTGMDLFLCTIDKGSWTSKWNKIFVEDDAGIGPSNPPLPSNSIYFERSFYVPSGCCSIAKVDIEEQTCKKWKKIKAYKLKEEDIGYNVSILGSYKDIIILQFAVLRVMGAERYIIAFKNEENVGMMHLVNSKVDVMEKNGSILSNTILNKNSSIYFPRMNGGI